MSNYDDPGHIPEPKPASSSVGAQQSPLPARAKWYRRAYRIPVIGIGAIAVVALMFGCTVGGVGGAGQGRAVDDLTSKNSTLTTENGALKSENSDLKSKVDTAQQKADDYQAEAKKAKAGSPKAAACRTAYLGQKEISDRLRDVTRKVLADIQAGDTSALQADIQVVAGINADEATIDSASCTSSAA